MVEVLFIGDEHVRKFVDEQTDGGRVAPLSFILAWIGGGVWTCAMFGWIGFAILLTLSLILHGYGVVFKIRGVKIHSITIMHGILWFYGAIVGYSCLFGKYTSLPEFIMKFGVLNWLLYHGFAFIIAFFINLIFTYVDENYNTVSIIIEPLEFFIGIVFLSCYVHLFWAPFFYYTVCCLVDWIVSSGKPCDGVYGGAGMLDALSIKPLALEGLMFLTMLILAGNQHFSPGDNWILRECYRIMGYNI